MSKAALELTQQLAKLKSRGLTLPSDQQFARFLYDNNYYRLSGYWRYMQVDPERGDNKFLATASVESIETVYRFDAGLRNILLDGIAEVEIALRSRLAYWFAIKVPHVRGYLEPTSYSDEAGRTDKNGHPYEFRTELIKSIERDLGQSKERFVKAHRDRGMDIPVWVAIETLSLGTVSKMYRLIADDDIRYAISKSFGVPDPGFAVSLFHSLSTLRNICAHHGRLWNRVPARAMPVLNALKTDHDKRIYERTPWSWFTMVAFLADGVRGDTTFSDDLWRHVGSYPELHEGLKRPHNR